MSSREVVVEPLRVVMTPCVPFAVPGNDHTLDRRPERYASMNSQIVDDVADNLPEVSLPEEIRKVWHPLVLKRIVGSLAVEEYPALRGSLAQELVARRDRGGVLDRLGGVDGKPRPVKERRLVVANVETDRDVQVPSD